VSLVRDAVRGARDLPDDPAGRVVAGATRAVAEAERLSGDGARLVQVSPRQSLVRLHVAAVGGDLPQEQVGRPRRGGERARGVDVLGPAGAASAGAAPGGVPAAEAAQRLDALVALLAASTRAPVLVLAAVASAEMLCAAPFVAGNGVVARALQRTLVVGRGLDPVGATVPESALLAEPARYAAALHGYAAGTADGVAGWLRFTASTVVAGAAEGTVIADAVLAGRTPRS
jgi:hypothetical protein